MNVTDMAIQVTIWLDVEMLMNQSRTTVDPAETCRKERHMTARTTKTVR
jgi:hypothetical protein